MLVLGLTGGIACGKSNISEKLRELGAVIIDGDVLSRELTCEGGAALPLLREAFGDGVFDEKGQLARRALGAAVFGNDAKRTQLDEIMQPLVRARILEQLCRAREEHAEVAVLDMPLLFEAGIEALCDRVWCAYLPREEQLARLMARDGFSAAQAEARLQSQMDTAEKARRADVVIDTSGSIDYTRSKIPALLAEEKRRAGIEA